jgi:hypothetical protein
MYLMCGEKYVNADLELVDEPLDIWEHYAIINEYGYANSFYLYTKDNDNQPKYIVNYKTLCFSFIDISKKVEFFVWDIKDNIINNKYKLWCFGNPRKCRTQTIRNNVKYYSPVSAINRGLEFYLIEAPEFGYVLK